MENITFLKSLFWIEANGLPADRPMTCPTATAIALWPPGNDDANICIHRFDCFCVQNTINTAERRWPQRGRVHTVPAALEFAQFRSTVTFRVACERGRLCLLRLPLAPHPCLVEAREVRPQLCRGE